MSLPIYILNILSFHFFFPYNLKSSHTHSVIFILDITLQTKQSWRKFFCLQLSLFVLSIEEYYRFYLEIWFYPTPQSLPVWFWFSAVCPPQTCHQSLQCCSAYHCLNCCGCFIKAAPLFFSFLRVLPLTTFQVLNCSLWIGIHVGAVGADVCI